MKRTIALAGNPNSGKTSLFNELTGANQYVGNWPGVTVDRKGGYLRDHEEVEILDLPGIYSLSPYSPEEMVTRQYLLQDKPDMVVNVVDATNLERNLYLTSQLLETGLPMVVVLNMMDLVEQRGDKVNPTALSRELGCPVVPVSVLRREGIQELLQLILGEIPAAPAPLRFPDCVEKALAALGETLHCTRWEQVKLLENDSTETEKLTTAQKHEAESLRLAVEEEMGDDIASVIAAGRYDAILDFIPQVVTKAGHRSNFSMKLDAVLTHRVFGLLIFVGVMWAVYYLSINTVGDWGTAWANEVLFGPVVGGWLEGFIGSVPASAESLTMFSAVLSMVLLFPTMLRRLHDLNRSGSWLYLVILPFLLEYMCPHLPGMLHTVVLYALYAVNVCILVACFCLRGSRGLNDFGEKPRRIRKFPMSLTGRGSRREFVVWFPILSVLSLGIALLGRSTLECSPQLSALITDGIVAGVGAVLGFLPQMAVLFLLLATLEDCGYMARVAFMMDRIFRTIGLSGKSFIPLLVSMGCGVPGVMATRIIENEKDRRMSVMLTCFVPCGAKLPIIALIGAVMGQDASIATIAYFAGIGSVILGGWMLRKTHMFAGSYTPFVMELPPYHMPSGVNINVRAMERCKAFARKAGTVIFLASALIWTLSNYTWSFRYLNTKEHEAAIEQSMLANVGNTFAPLFAPLGWGDWRPAVGTVTGLIAKENVVGTFGVLYPAAEEAAAQENDGDGLPRTSDVSKANALSVLTMGIWRADGEIRRTVPAAAESEEDEPSEQETASEAERPNLFFRIVNYFFGAEADEETAGVAANLKAAGAFSTMSALSFMIFNLLCAPCFAACGAIHREMNSARWTWFAIGYMCVWAYVVSLLIYQLGTWASTGEFGPGQAIACIIAAAVLYMIVRPNKYTKKH